MVEIMASPTQLFGAGLFIVWWLLVVTSAWLKGRSWYYATIAALGGCLALMFGGISAAAWLAIGWMFLFFFYIHTVSYLTRTRALDLTYNSPAAFGAFAATNNLRGPHITALRAIPYLLFVSVVVGGIVGVLRT